MIVRNLLFRYKARKTSEFPVTEKTVVSIQIRVCIMTAGRLLVSSLVWLMTSIPRNPFSKVLKSILISPFQCDSSLFLGHQFFCHQIMCHKYFHSAL